MSRKIANLTDSNYRMFFTGNKKGKVVTALSVMQYIISIGLVIGTLTIHAQLKLTQRKAECYRNLIEIGKLERRETGCQHIRSRTEEQTGK